MRAGDLIEADPNDDLSKVFLNEEEDMEMNEEDLVLDQKVGSTLDVDQDLTRIHNQDREDQDEDLMIHHAPVKLGGGPKLQLLSQPEPEVVKTFLSKPLPSCLFLNNLMMLVSR